MESSSTGRMHFHGIIKIRDIGRFLMTDLRSIGAAGTYEIDTLNDTPEIWYEYCLKQYHIWNDIISITECHPTYYPIKNDFNNGTSMIINRFDMIKKENLNEMD